MQFKYYAYKLSNMQTIMFRCFLIEIFKLILQITHAVFIFHHVAEFVKKKNHIEDINRAFWVIWFVFVPCNIAWVKA